MLDLLINSEKSAIFSEADSVGSLPLCSIGGFSVNLVLPIDGAMQVVALLSGEFSIYLHACFPNVAVFSCNLITVYKAQFFFLLLNPLPF